MAVANVTGYLDEVAIRRIVLPKLLLALKKNTTDTRILMNALLCIIERLDKQQIIDEVLPVLWEVKLQDAEIVLRVVSECETCFIYFFFIPSMSLKF